MLPLLLASLLSVLSCQSAPLETIDVIPSLSTSQIDFFTPYTHFASSVYCQPRTTISWTCGANCQANPDFIPADSGGDGASVQFWYVGYSPSLNTVIVAHQGTDPSKIEADATDADAILENLDSKNFPGVPSSVHVHSGFANEQAKTATRILSVVQRSLSAHNAPSVTIVGHSLGAAIALLDSVYLNIYLSVPVRTIVYGMPRVGNQAFADYVDANLSLTRINNKKDIAPIVPGRFMGYHHPSGEVHITETGAWKSCPGQDNSSKSCSVGDVPNIFEGNLADHEGPYNGITMGC